MWVWSLGREDPLEEVAWQPTPVFLPGESYGQRSLADYEPWGHKESDMTEVTEYARTQWHKVIYVEFTKGCFLFCDECAFILYILLWGIIIFYDLSLSKYSSYRCCLMFLWSETYKVMMAFESFRWLAAWHSAMKQRQNGWDVVIFDSWLIHDIFLLTLTIEAAVCDSSVFWVCSPCRERLIFCGSVIFFHILALLPTRALRSPMTIRLSDGRAAVRSLSRSLQNFPLTGM